jgi:hypothetical protein
MKPLRAHWVTMLLVGGLSGCGKVDAVSPPAPAAPYNQPAGWSSECYGRFVVDVPGKLEFGAGDNNFRRGRESSNYVVNKEAPFRGGVSVATNLFRETAVMAAYGSFDSVWKQAEDHYEIHLVRDGVPVSEREVRRRATQRLLLPNNAFIWRHKNQFDFGTLVESDMRARMLHGRLSGEGSLTQAKAVIDTLWPRYRPRKSGEIPNGAGICTPYGFLADPAGATERDYSLAFSFPDARHTNAILRLEVSTHSQAMVPYGLTFKSVPIEQWPTPWQEDQQQAAESKAKCQPQQGTASRDLFGCIFAGVRSIKKHREVEYLTLMNGQRARLLVMELYPAINNYYEYEVRLETQGTPDSATQPNIRLSMYGLGKETDIATMRGKTPPSIDEAVSTVRTIAASLRLRPGGVVENSPVKDTLEGVR